MKKVHSKIIAILCAFLIISGVPTSVLATNSQYNTSSSFSLDALEGFLTTAVLPFNNEYALPKYSQIALGTRIPVYTCSEDQAIPCRSSSDAYPIIANGEIIGLLEVSCAENGLLSFAYREGVAEDMEIGSRVAILYDDSVLNIVTENDNFKLEYSSSLESKSYLNLSKETTNTYSTRANYPSVASLNVPKKQQTTTLTCWAACVASVGQYISGRSYTCDDIIEMTGITGSANMTQTRNSFGDIGANLSNILTSLGADKLVRNIYEGNPIIGGFLYQVGKVGHMMVIRGYSSGSSYLNMLLMDPADATYISVSIINDSNMKFTYSGRTWFLNEYIIIYN